MSALLLPRRKFLLGLGAVLAAPAIVRVSSLMPVHDIFRSESFLVGNYLTDTDAWLIDVQTLPGFWQIEHFVTATSPPTSTPAGTSAPHR